MSDGRHDAVPPIKKNDPNHYQNHLFRADELLYSLNDVFRIAAAEESSPKGVGAAGADDSSDSDVACLHVHYTEAEVDALVDCWLRSRMFGDATSVRALVTFAYDLIRTLADQGAELGWYGSNNDEED